MWKTIALAAALAAFSTTAAIAGPPCGPRKAVLKTLAETYRELPLGMGVGEDGQLLELLTSKDGNTWTVILTTPGGLSCLVAAGQAWESRRQLAPLPEA